MKKILLLIIPLAFLGPVIQAQEKIDFSAAGKDLKLKVCFSNEDPLILEFTDEELKAADVTVKAEPGATLTVDTDYKIEEEDSKFTLFLAKENLKDHLVNNKVNVTITYDNQTRKLEFTNGCKTQAANIDDFQQYIDTVIFNPLGIMFRPGIVPKNGDTTYIVLDHNLNPFDGTVLPDCNRKNTHYRIFIVFDQRDSLKGAEYLVEDNFENDFAVDNTAFGTDDTKKIEIGHFSSKATEQAFQSGVDFTVRLFKRARNNALFEVKKKTFTISSCEKPIHASILGGFYFSNLNDPENIVKDTIGSSNTTTLFADNANGQRALTVMALFYPSPRQRDYSHKDLSFMQKWGVVFGTKLSQDLFTDLLLGLNYEFAKGASFSTGLHYGKHSVVRGYDDFEFGKTPYTGTFSNDEITQQWDFGWFIGVTIDLRVIASMRLAGKSENNLNKNNDGE